MRLCVEINMIAQPIYIRSKGDNDGEDKIRMILCGAEFYIEDLKEELSFLPVCLKDSSLMKTLTWRQLVREKDVLKRFVWFLLAESCR